MTTFINNEGEIIPINKRDADLVNLTIAVDKFIEHRKREGLYYPEGIIEQCILSTFVMWLQDNNKIIIK